jgi:hypothetical protein
MTIQKSGEVVIHRTKFEAFDSTSMIHISESESVLLNNVSVKYENGYLEYALRVGNGS